MKPSDPRPALPLVMPDLAAGSPTDVAGTTRS